MRPGWSSSIGCGAGDFTYDSVSPNLEGNPFQKIKTSIWKALFWHSHEKAGFLKRHYVVDNSSTKAGWGAGVTRGRGKPQERADLSAKASDEN